MSSQRLIRNDEPKPLLPLQKEAMIEVLQPVSAAAFTGIAMSLVQAGQGLPDDMNVLVRGLVLYAFFPIGLASLIASCRVKKEPRLVGWAAGWLLFEFYFVTVIGGIVSVVKTGSNVWLGAGVTVVLLAVTTLVWCHCCSYPKCLRGLMCCCRKNDGENTISDTCAACRSQQDVNGRAFAQAVEGQTQCNTCGAALLDEEAERRA